MKIYESTINDKEGEKSSMVDDDNSLKDKMSEFMKLEINRRIAQGTSLI